MCDHRRWGIRDSRESRHRRRQCVLQFGSGWTISIVNREPRVRYNNVYEYFLLLLPQYCQHFPLMILGFME
jgi:hypothetical protein